MKKANALSISPSVQNSSQETRHKLKTIHYKQNSHDPMIKKKEK